LTNQFAFIEFHFYLLATKSHFGFIFIISPKFPKIINVIKTFFSVSLWFFIFLLDDSLPIKQIISSTTHFNFLNYQVFLSNFPTPPLNGFNHSRSIAIILAFPHRTSKFINWESWSNPIASTTSPTTSAPKIHGLSWFLRFYFNIWQFLRQRISNFLSYLTLIFRTHLFESEVLLEYFQYLFPI